ncbi:hypothetical protein K504DRAFT_476429 [Pleomassaria siparia CBS 279.74]|uniref:PinX1-related protein 1 n=1 Tax=Pleomassaria siparia CBS 279.74 TaxID=1314801 RepID=A0A6G1KCG7_9PLEO|nr:hypothetical protein K504DRAFT_476429 [Pleomassaria siparia CBS 279.74]
MGLAGPKNRTRISNDPQNTHWAKNTDRFGHRILASQGWTPGSSLGAENAAHASHYTAASHSHIRVLLKEDTLGLGAKRGSGKAENFGLTELESVLGRLNGREADVKKEEERRLDIERRGFVAQKYGFMNFVSGGFLVGDKIEKSLKSEKDVDVKVEVKDEEVEVDMVTIKERKRKRSGDADDEPKLKRKKKSMNLRAAIGEEETAEETCSKVRSKKDKKDKKEKKEKKRSSASTSEEPLSDKAKRKAARAERRARKEEKRQTKALKKAAKAARSKSNSASSSESSDDEEKATTSTTAPTTGASTPITATLAFGAGGRHAHRRKYIQHKTMAGMDPQMLREVR